MVGGRGTVDGLFDDSSDRWSVVVSFNAPVDGLLDGSVDGLFGWLVH